MKRYNTPHRSRVIKTRLTEEEYAEFSERVTLCKMSQAEFIRQALIKSSIRPVITVSPVNDELLSAVGKLTAEYGKIGGNLNQIARCLNEYGAPHCRNHHSAAELNRNRTSAYYRWSSTLCSRSCFRCPRKPA